MNNFQYIESYPQELLDMFFEHIKGDDEYKDWGDWSDVKKYYGVRHFISKIKSGKFKHIGRIKQSSLEFNGLMNTVRRSVDNGLLETLNEVPRPAKPKFKQIDLNIDFDSLYSLPLTKTKCYNGIEYNTFFLNKDFATIHQDWDYNCDKSELFDVQHEWNQTLMVQINQMSAKIHKSTFRGGANMIIAHRNLKPLLHSFRYYHVGSMRDSLSGRYEVQYVDDIEDNVLYMFNSKLQYEIFIPNISKPAVPYIDPITGEEGESMAELTLRIIGPNDKEEFTDYLKNQVGRLEIKNYN